MVKDYLKAASLGVEMAVAVFLGAFLGYQLDKLWPIAPWGMVAGIAVGAVVGFWNAYKLAIKNERS